MQVTCHPPNNYHRDASPHVWICSCRVCTWEAWGTGELYSLPVLLRHRDIMMPQASFYSICVKTCIVTMSWPSQTNVGDTITLTTLIITTRLMSHGTHCWVTRFSERTKFELWSLPFGLVTVVTMPKCWCPGITVLEQDCNQVPSSNKFRTCLCPWSYAKNENMGKRTERS